MTSDIGLKDYYPKAD